MHAYSLDYILCIFHDEAFGKIHYGYVIVFQTIGLATLSAGEVDMIDVLVVSTAAHAIFLETRPVVYLMKKMMLYEKTQGTEYAGTVHRWHERLHVIQGEGLRLA